MRRDSNEHHITQVPPTENKLGEMQTMEEVAEHVRMNYPETTDSRFVAQPFDDFLFPWEEGSMNNPITIEEDEGFSVSDSQRTTKTSTSDGGKTSFALH